ncbi:hypothetical protein PHLCEN_2v13708, partial [Hermanssonia centrifuga]
DWPQSGSIGHLYFRTIPTPCYEAQKLDPQGLPMVLNDDVDGVDNVDDVDGVENVDGVDGVGGVHGREDRGGGVARRPRRRLYETADGVSGVAMAVSPDKSSIEEACSWRGEHKAPETV